MSKAPATTYDPSPGKASAAASASSTAGAPTTSHDPTPGKAPAAALDPSPGETPIAAHDRSSSTAGASTAAHDPSDRQTLSARAMADVLTGGSGAHEGRKPTSSLFTARASSPASAAPIEPSAPAAPAPDSRPASAASPGPPTVAAHADVRSATAGAPAATGEAITLSRAEVDAALADFGRLTAAMHGSFSAAGVVVDAVSDGTLFQRAGLRAGDVIAAVDGIRLRSLDDAANLYARASKATAITAQIVRSGKPMTLRVAIR
jgi:hypothetical protein